MGKRKNSTIWRKIHKKRTTLPWWFYVIFSLILIFFCTFERIDDWIKGLIYGLIYIVNEKNFLLNPGKYFTLSPIKDLCIGVLGSLLCSLLIDIASKIKDDEKKLLLYQECLRQIEEDFDHIQKKCGIVDKCLGFTDTQTKAIFFFPSYKGDISFTSFYREAVFKDLRHIKENIVQMNSYLEEPENINELIEKINNFEEEYIEYENFPPINKDKTATDFSEKLQDIESDVRKHLKIEKKENEKTGET